MQKRILITGGVIVLVLLLAGAAFIGGQLLSGKGLQSLSSDRSGISIAYAGHSITLKVQPAKNLPQTPAVLKGAFDHRQNNSIFVGTGSQVAMPEKNQSGNVISSSGFSGPTFEVVVTSQTTIYKDVTLSQYNGDLHNGQQIQQVVEPGALDEVGQNSEITVWGQQTGGRIVATVFVYTLPQEVNP